MFADMTFNRWKEYKPNNVDKRETNERVRATIIFCCTRPTMQTRLVCLDACSALSRVAVHDG